MTPKSILQWDIFSRVAEKTLLGRISMGNIINLGQTSRLNMDKLGIDRY